MMQPVILLARPPFAAPGGAPTPPPEPAGDWLGRLETGVLRLRLLLHISRTTGGPWRATFDSLDQNASGIPIAAVTIEGGHLRLDVPVAHASYEGDVRGDSIAGTWTQGGASLPLVFDRVTAGSALPSTRRPQDPVEPYPYRADEVSYENRQAGIRLAGTLTVPPGAGPFPAAILITGSGPQDRDETVFGHRPFLVLADHLTRHGLAVLRSDDRGEGRSGGTFKGATSADFATDVEAALAWLETRPEIDRRRIGLVGHSEGGLIAPMVAATHPEVAFLVLWAAPGVPGDDLLVEQVRRLMLARGKTAAEADRAADDERAVVDVVKRGAIRAVLDAELRGRVPPGQMEALLKAAESPWFRYFLTCDPALALRRVRCPVLAITGSLDVQAPADQNLPAIRRALDAGGNRQITIEEMPGLNHLLQTAQTGDVNEYAAIDETIAPAALEAIASWIRAQVEAGA